MTRTERKRLALHLHVNRIRKLKHNAYYAAFQWAVDTGRLNLDDLLAMDRAALDAAYEQLTS